MDYGSLLHMGICECFVLKNSGDDEEPGLFQHTQRSEGAICFSGTLFSLNIS